MLFFFSIISTLVTSNNDTLIEVTSDSDKTLNKFENSLCDRYDFLPIDQYKKSYKGRQPVVFRSLSSLGINSTFKSRVTRSKLLAKFSNEQVILASSNSNSHDKMKSRLDDYLYNYVDVVVKPNTSALDIWYLFGDTPMTGKWKKLMQTYNLPMDSSSDEGLPTFGIGGLHSGVSFHTHGAAFSESVIGTKKWFLSAPKNKPLFNLSSSQLDWTLVHEHEEVNKFVFSCIVNEGEIIYVPPNWWHATLNLESYNAFVSTFTREQIIYT